MNPIIPNPKSKYKGVNYHFYNKTRVSNWRMTINIEGRRATKDFVFDSNGERFAAIAYDKKRLELDKEPVNILKKK